MSALRIFVRIKIKDGFNPNDLKDGLTKGLRETGYIIENVNVQKDESDIGRITNWHLLTYVVRSEKGFDRTQLFGGLHMTAEEMGTFTVESINFEDA